MIVETLSFMISQPADDPQIVFPRAAGRLKLWSLFVVMLRKDLISSLSLVAGSRSHGRS